MIQLTEHVFYVPGRTNSGIIINDNNECVIVDTGIDDDSGRKILNSVEAKGFRVKAIINTHFHADHVGGNNIILRRTNARVYASKFDAPFIENPILEPMTLYGSYPIKELQTKLLMASPSKIYETLSDTFDNIQIIPLHGHTLGMIGLLVEDVMFIADALFPENVLEKYKIPYHMNMRQAFETLNKLKNIKHKFYVPSHMPHQSDLMKIIDENIKAIDNVREIIKEILSKETSLDMLISKLAEILNVEIQEVGYYYLYESTIKSYLAWLSEEGIIKPIINNNKISYKIR